MLDLHMHLERGALTMEYLKRFLDRAAEVGIDVIGVTPHLYRFKEARGIFSTDYTEPRCVNTVDLYTSLMEPVKAAGLSVKFGLEADYIPGREDEIRRVLALFPLDYAIGSVHWLRGWGFDINAAEWAGRSVEDVYREYYETLTKAAESGLFDIIGHPGNIAYYGHRPSEEFLSRLEERFLIRVARVPVVLEINSGGLLKPGKEMFPRPRVARRIAELGIPISTGSDAHRPEDVGHDFLRLYADLAGWGFKEVCGFTERKRFAVDLVQSH